MFYSHQLLARKAPLGQIWMAATMHAKINRKKLNKLNIIQICEEILNPSVPMALRLSGILMGGVVIVYERKVKLLYDDVTRLLTEINGAWRVKAASDPTVLPKGRTHARKEAVTLPENQEADFGDIEQTLNYSYAARDMDFQQTTYVAMRLDDLEEPHINNNPEQEDLTQSFHQADIENITLFEYHGSYQANAETYDRFERFDIEGDDETQMNFKCREGAEKPATLVPSPPREYDIPRGDLNPGQQLQGQHEQDRQEWGRQGPLKRKARRTASSMMDYSQTIIPGHIYQSWLHDASDIVSRGGKRRKARGIITPTTKVSKLMDLPPTLLTDQLCTQGNGGFPYSLPLHELWSKSTHPLQNSIPESPPPYVRPERSPQLPQDRMQSHNQTEYHFEDFNGEFGSQNILPPAEKRRTNLLQEDVSIENLMARVQANLANNDFQSTETNVMVTPGYSGDDVRSIPSSASGHGAASSNSDINSKRSNKRKSENGNIGLEPVAEDIPWHHPDPNFELTSLPENDLTPGNELLVETGPTQTQRPVFTRPDERITESIQRQMKTHFETPGSAQVESLNKLAIGMNRKAAAMLFYQTCVLATRDVLRVEQRQPYGDIFIARGPKM